MTSTAVEEARWLRSAVGLHRLDVALVSVSGDDRLSWLNGQITNDLRTKTAGQITYALAVDVRGKILADLWVLHREEDLLVLLPPSERAALLEHFDKYIVMEDVELGPRGDLVVLTVQGPRSEALASASTAAAARGERFDNDRLDAGGFDLLVERAEADGVFQELAHAARELGGGVVDQPGWEIARVLAGRPRFGVDFGPANYPQEAGLRRAAVSFQKGCYLGQEVVCMLENRGQLRRSLVQLRAAAAAAGDALAVDGAVVGEVTSVVAADEGVRGLGYVKRAWAVAGAEVTGPSGPLVVTAVVGD